MHDCDKNNPSVILANFYHKSFTFRKNAAFYTDGSKDLEGAVRAIVFSPEIEDNIKHRLPSETFIFIMSCGLSTRLYRLSTILTFPEAFL